MWSHLRQLRHSPPDAASLGDRKKAFCAALEQAEQLLRGAQNVENTVRPLLIFYGLSQAARAVAAGSRTRGDWRIGGHGLQDARVRGNSLPSVKMTVAESGQSTRAVMERVLNSSPWVVDRHVTLAQIWAATPGVPTLPDSVLSAPALQIRITHQESYVGTSSEVMVGLSGVPRELLDGDNEDAVQRLFEKHYPVLLSTRPADASQFAPNPRFPSGPPTVWPDSSTASIDRSMPMPPGQTISDVHRSLSVSHYGVHTIPSLAGSMKQTHPFILWWSLFYALSMRARYDPVGWTKDLDVNNSENAVTLEEVLEGCLDVLPRLIFETIERAANTK